jgi:hypothetical protein
MCEFYFPEHFAAAVKVWLEYVQFAVEKMSIMPEGVEFPRDVFERGMVACGLHVGESGLLWDAYLEFEKAMLQSLKVSGVGQGELA